MTATNAKYQKTTKGQAAQARWKAKNPDYYTNKNKEYWKSRKAHMQAIKRKSMYGCVATRPCPEHCEGCSRPFAEASKYHGACFDHDHKTSEFRGWLCNDCNLALGYAKDSRDRLQLLINYLDRHELLR